MLTKIGDKDDVTDFIEEKKKTLSSKICITHTNILKEPLDPKKAIKGYIGELPTETWESNYLGNNVHLFTIQISRLPNNQYLMIEEQKP